MSSPIAKGPVMQDFLYPRAGRGAQYLNFATKEEMADTHAKEYLGDGTAEQWKCEKDGTVCATREGLAIHERVLSRTQLSLPEEAPERLEFLNAPQSNAKTMESFSVVFVVHDAEEARALLPVMACLEAQGHTLVALSSGPATAEIRSSSTNVECVSIQDLEKKLSGYPWHPRLMRDGRGGRSPPPPAMGNFQAQGPEPLPAGAHARLAARWQGADGSSAYVVKECKSIAATFPAAQLVLTGMSVAWQLTMARTFAQQGKHVLAFKAEFGRDAAIEKAFLPWVRAVLVATPQPAEALRQACSEIWNGVPECWPDIRVTGSPRLEGAPQSATQEAQSALRRKLGLPVGDEAQSNPLVLYIAGSPQPHGQPEGLHSYAPSVDLFLRLADELQGRARFVLLYPDVQSHGMHDRHIAARGLESQVRTLPRDVNMDEAIAISHWVLAFSSLPCMLALGRGKPSAVVVAPSDDVAAWGPNRQAAEEARIALTGTENVLAGFSPLCGTVPELVAHFTAMEQANEFGFDSGLLAAAGIPIQGVAQGMADILTEHHSHM